MSKILFVNSCVRPQSRTMILAKRVLSKLDGEVEEVNLVNEKMVPLDYRAVAERNKAADQKDWDAPALRYVRQFIAADVIVIAAPYWDLSFPAMLKTYIEAVTVDGVSFYYTPEGYPAGLCQAKKLIYVTTAGGPILDPDHGFGYIKSIAETFYGIPEVIGFRAENLDVIGVDVDAVLAKTLDEIDGWDFAE